MQQVAAHEAGLERKAVPLEVVNATPEDRLQQPVLDNMNRATFGVTDRMKAAKVLYDNGIDSTRAAFALAVSPK
jgi:hypothetical protein